MIVKGLDYAPSYIKLFSNDKFTLEGMKSCAYRMHNHKNV